MNKFIIPMLILLAWATSLPAQITREQADEIMLQHINNDPCNPVENLRVTNSEPCIAHLTWEKPYMEPFSEEWIKHCIDDKITGRVGAGFETNMTAAMRFTPDDLATYGIVSGDTITKIALGVGTEIALVNTMEIRIWEGGSSITDAGQLVYTQPVTDFISFAENAMNEVILTTPFVIDATKEIRIGYSLHTFGGYPIGRDDGPAIVGKGDLFMSSDFFDDSWVSIYELLNWNWNFSIKALVNKNIPVSYDIYCNGTKLGNTTSLAYDHTTAESGEYNYCVVAIYETCESETVCEDVDIICDSQNECEAISDLISEKCNNNCVMLKWNEPESNLSIEGYHVFRNNLQLTDVLITNTSYMDENLSVGEYEYYLITYYTNGCVSDSSNHVAETIGLGIEEFIDGIVIYPNPTSGQLQIMNYELQVTGIEIFDVFGRNVTPVETLCATSLQQQPTTTINISHLPVGVYFIRIQTETGIVTQKIIKH